MIITRGFTAELEIREDQRQIVGLAVPYGVQIRVGRYLETFRHGAFADADPAPLTATHPRSQSELPIGVSVELQDQPDGLHGVWRVSKTALGDEVLELVRDGAVSGLSVGFVPVTDRWTPDRSRVERMRALLDHVAVVRQPAYPEARIAALRAAQSRTGPLLNLARLRQR